jgi:hypothetical protein
MSFHHHHYRQKLQQYRHQQELVMDQLVKLRLRQQERRFL